MHWTGTGTAVRSVEEAESGPLSIMPVRSRRSLSRVSGRRTGRISQPVESPELLPRRLSRPPGPTIAPAPGQLVVTAALVALTSLATAVVMAQGIRHLDTTPGPDTTPYLADAPRGPVRVPPLGRIGGRGASVLGGDVSNQVGPVSPDLSGPVRGAPGPLSGGGSPDAATPGRLLSNDPSAGTGPSGPRRTDTVVGGSVPGDAGPLIGGGGPLGGPLFGGLPHGHHRSGWGRPPGDVPHDRGAGHRAETVPPDRRSAKAALAKPTSAETTSSVPTAAETTAYVIPDETTVDTVTSETADSDVTLSDTEIA